MPQLRDTGLYLKDDSIAAIATGLGGAVAIVRTSGPSALSAARTLMKRESVERVHRATLYAGSGQTLDDAVVLAFPNPQSFTGEDVVEYCIHGSPLIATRLLQELKRLGLRQALPGEFSFRAVRNGKMSLSQAQALPDILAAENEGALSLALEKLSGDQNRFVAEVAAELKRVCMFGEVGIDFSDQDLDEVSLDRLKRDLASSRSKLEALRDSFERGQRLQSGVRTVIVGRPNAGKSSLFNALLGEERSIVTDVAGTTRDIVKETMTLAAEGRAITFRFEDTAGLRSTGDVVEGLGIQRTEQAMSKADLIVWVVDLSSPELTLGDGRPLPVPAKTLVVLNKRDLVSSGATVDRLQQDLHARGFKSVVTLSAHSADDIHGLSSTLVRFCGDWVERQPGEILLTREDQREAVRQALAHLDRASQAETLDLFAADIRQALHSLEPMIGATVPDDILGKIFAEFCIGK